MPKVTIYTQVYNAGPYLEPCIQSVLNQTERDWEWILVDSCSTDESPALIDAYAEKDQRIIPVHMPENRFYVEVGLVRQYGSGTYFTKIDHDDWWEPDYLERLLKFYQENDLDLAITGVIQYFEKQGASRLMRKAAKQIVLTPEEFARGYEQYGLFAGALWGCIKPMEKYLAMEHDPNDQRLAELKLNWRYDTICMLNYIEHCQRIGIDDSALYHYRMRAGSQIWHYDNTRFLSNVVFYERLQDFLKNHGALDDPMRDYLEKRYFFEMQTTLNVLENAAAPEREKIQTCAEIATHPITVHALTYASSEQDVWREKMRGRIETAVHSGESLDMDAFRSVLRLFAPNCCDSVTANSLRLFAADEELLKMLLQDDQIALAQRLAEIIPKDAGTGALDAGIVLYGLLPEDSPLRCVRDTALCDLFRRYESVFNLVLEGGYLTALDQMTKLLLSGGGIWGEEDFLQLYLTLAAVENQVSAFVFGKIRLAGFYQGEDRTAECRTVLADLEEMGAGELEEVVSLRKTVGEEK